MKKLLRRPERFKGMSIGLDIHKGRTTYSVLNRRGDEKDKGSFASKRAELAKFVETWKSRDDIQVTIEACGCFLWFYDFLKGAIGKERVHVAQPSKVKVIAKSQEKTDANDAWWLAYLLYEGRLPEAHVAEGVERELRFAERERRTCVDARSDLLRHMNSHFAQAGIKAPRSWHTSQEKREEMKEKIKGLDGERLRAGRRLFKLVLRMTKEVQYWEKRMASLCEEIPAVEAAWEELPGFGPVIGATVYGEMGDAKMYYSPKAFARASGLTPGYRESGGRVKGCGIVRAGNRRARWAFTMAAKICLKCKTGAGVFVKEWILAHAQKGRLKKAIVAAARKLAEGYWRVNHDGEAFDVRKAFPAKKKA